MNGAAGQRGVGGPLYNSGNLSISLKLLQSNLKKNLSVPFGFHFQGNLCEMRVEGW